MISSDLSWLEMRGAAFILALQEPKIANLIFMDSKIILNLLGRRRRRVTAPSIKLVSSKPPSVFHMFLSKGPVCTEGCAGRAAVLQIHTVPWPEWVWKHTEIPREQKPSWSFTFSSPCTSTALHCLNKQPNQAGIASPQHCGFLWTLKRMASISIHAIISIIASPHTSFFSSIWLLRWQGLPCLPASGAEPLCDSAAAICSSLSKPSRQAQELLQQSGRLYGVDEQQLSTSPP